MNALPELRSVWEKYKGWFFLGFIAYCFISARKLFAATGDGLGALATYATGDIVQAATDKSDKAAIIAACPGLKKTGVSDELLAQLRTDAATLAANFRTTDGDTPLFPGLGEQQAAFTLLKQRYSRLLLLNNKPVYNAKGKDGKLHAVSQTIETAQSMKRTINCNALAPLYRQVTKGHDLKNDVRKYIKDFTMTPYLKWIL